MRLFALLVLLSCLACSPPPAAPGVYYWQADGDFTPEDAAGVREQGITDVYLRYFDVARGVDGEVGARARVQREAKIERVAREHSLRVRPVVFLVNDIFRKPSDPDTLAVRLLDELGHPGQLQVDCDWTPATRDAYFAFLQALHANQPGLKLCATVRLHQYRERRHNGVPPADRGLLMCYNMAPVQERGTRDAIFDLNLLAGYLGSAGAYPLPLDAALPVFAWGAAFRDDRFLGITPSPAADDPNLVAHAPDRYLVRRDTTVGRLLLRAGDELRRDGPDGSDELRRAVAVLHESGEFENLLFFDWRPGRLEQYGTAELINQFYAR